jgi:hypothetical protein
MRRRCDTGGRAYGLAPKPAPMSSGVSSSGETATIPNDSGPK